MLYYNGLIHKLTQRVKNQNTKTFNDIITFDTESSKIADNLVCTYLWSACINGEYVYGRTPQSCFEFFDELSDYEGKWYVWVHCLGFDSIYLNDVLGEFDDVFAIAKYRPIRIKWRNVVFRCTYALSNLKLEELAEFYNLAHKKGEMNHDLIRHYETELTDEEWEYVMNDVFVLYDYVKILQKKYGDFANVPLTFTSCDRDLYREYIWKYSYKKEGDNPKYDKLSTIRKDMLDHAPQNYEQYTMCRDTYHGAFNYINPEYIGVTITSHNGIRTISADAHSQYPNHMVINQYPNALKPLPLDKCTVPNFVSQPFAIAKFAFEYLTLRDNGFPCISESEVLFGDGGKGRDIVNGKVIECKNCIISLNSIQFNSLYKNYKFKVYRILGMFSATTDYLELGMITMIRDLYRDKTLAENSVKRATAKTNINALSGMFAYDYTKDDVKYDNGKWSYDDNLKKDREQVSKKIEDLDKKWRRRFDPTKDHRENHDNMNYTKYQCAGAITAYAKADLLDVNQAIGRDKVLYNDTDCVKFICRNEEEYQECLRILAERDKQIDRKIEKMCAKTNAKYGTNFTLSDFRPTDYDSTLGHMPVEHEYYKFKMLKTKCYLTCEIVEHEGKEYHVINPVISGANKQIALKTLLLNIKPDYQTVKGDTILSHYSEADLDLIFERFSFDLIIPNGTTTHFYTPSSEEDIEVTDYNGKTITLHGTTRGIIVQPTDFSLSNIPDPADCLIYSGLDAGNGTLGC